MADRSVSVRLRADISQFQRSMTQASASTRRLDGDVQSAGRDLDTMGASADRSGRQIDKLSGRLSLLAQAGLAIGPAFVPMIGLAVPAVAGLTSALGFAAVGAGTALLAFHGVGDALSKLNTAQLDPTVAHLKAARLAMEKLSPSASEFVRLLDQTGPSIAKLKQSAGADLFPGLTIGLRGALKTLPQVRGLLEVVGGAVGNLGEMTGESLASGKWNDFLTFLKAEAPPAIESLGQMMGNLASGATELWMAFSPLNTDVLGWLQDASQSFEDWSTGLSQTQGFQDFVSYIQTSGPQVSQTLGAIGNMVLQVGEAFAPLGGPVLTILTTVADLISTIADSPLGTPLAAIATAVSTLSLLNKGLASTQGLLGGLRGGSAGGGGEEIGSVFQDNADQVRAAATQMRSSISGVGSTLRSSLGQGLAPTTGQMMALRTRMREVGTAGRQMAGAVGRAGAPLAALGFLSSGAAGSLGLTNTASLALAGSMLGGPGAAIGVGAGLLLDLKAAGESATGALDSLNDAATLGNLDTLSAKLTAAKAELTDYKSTDTSGFLGLGDIAQQVGTDVSNVSQGRFTDQSDEYAASIAAASKKQEELAASARVAADAQANLSSYVSGSNVALFAQTQSLESAVKSMQDIRSEALKAADAELGYKSAILDAKDAIKENGKTARNAGRALDLSTRAGIANKQALDSLAGAWNGQSDAAKNAKGALAQARQNFVTTATQMGLTEDAARRLARRLFEIPTKRVTTVTVLDAASQKIAGIRSEIASLQNKTIYINTVFTGRKPNAGGMGPQVGTSADGGTVTGAPRYPYGDKVLYRLAPGEEVISNRHGEADRFRSDRASGRIPGYADGGTAGSVAEQKKAQARAKKAQARARARGKAIDAFGDLSVDTGINSDGVSQALTKFQEDVDKVRGLYKDAGLQLVRQQKNTIDAIRGSAKEFDSLTATLKNSKDAQAAFSAEVGSVFNNDIFGNGLAGLGTQLQADSNDTAAFQGALSSAVAQGLDGGLFQALAKSGDLNTAQQLASSGAGGIASYEALFAQRENRQQQLGSFAGQSAFGGEVAANTAEVAKEVREMRKELSKLKTEIGAGVRDGSREGSREGTAQADRNRDTLTTQDSRGGGRGGGQRRR